MCVCCLGSPYQLLIIMGCRVVCVCLYLLCVEQLVEFDWDYDWTKAIFPADSCCCSTFDLQDVKLQRQSYAGTDASSQARSHTSSRVFDGRPEVMSAFFFSFL